MIRQVITHLGDDKEKHARLQMGSRLNGAEKINYDYSVSCINDSTQNIYFYIFQRTADQYDKTASLVWDRSKTKLGNGSSIRFEWKESFFFVWQGYGFLQPGVDFKTKGRCDTRQDPATFCDNGNTPTFTFKPPTTTTTTSTEMFSIKVSPNIPKNEYSIGIGMDENATFLEQALPGKTQSFIRTCSYWVAAGGDQTKQGMVLSNSNLDLKAEIIFPQNTRDLTINYDGTKFSQPYSDETT